MAQLDGIRKKVDTTIWSELHARNVEMVHVRGTGSAPQKFPSRNFPSKSLPSSEANEAGWKVKSVFSLTRSLMLHLVLLILFYERNST